MPQQRPNTATVGHTTSSGVTCAKVLTSIFSEFLYLIYTGAKVQVRYLANDISLERARLFCDKTILLCNKSQMSTQPGCPLWIGAISISKSWGVIKRTTRCTGPVIFFLSVVLQYISWSVWLRAKNRSVPLHG